MIMKWIWVLEIEEINDLIFGNYIIELRQKFDDVEETKPCIVISTKSRFFLSCKHIKHHRSIDINARYKRAQDDYASLCRSAGA